MKSRFFLKQSKASRLADPVGFELGEACLRSAGPGDRDKVAADFHECGCVRLDQRAESAAEQGAVVRLSAAFGGDEAGPDRRQGGIRQRA